MNSSQTIILQKGAHVMEHIHPTIESRKNKHLNAYERGQIQLLLEEGSVSMSSPNV